MTNEEALDTFEDVIGLLHLVKMALGSVNEDSAAVNLINNTIKKYPEAVDTAREAFKLLDQKIEIESKEDGENNGSKTAL